jgi:hypothetical protein
MGDNAVRHGRVLAGIGPHGRRHVIVPLWSVPPSPRFHGEAFLEAAYVKSPAAILLALSLLTTRAQAQQTDDRARSAARALAEDGVTALQNGDTEGAIDKLERSYQIMGLPTVGLWSARALAKAGRLVNASERYNEVSRWSGHSDPRQAQAQADASREREELLPRIPSVTLVIEGAKGGDLKVTLDGGPVLTALVGASQPINPGHHVAAATAGSQSAEQPFDIAEGQKLSVSLKLGAAKAGAAAPAGAAAMAAAPVASPKTEPAGATPPPSGNAPSDASPSWWNTQKIVAVALGGAGLVSGIVSGIFTASAASKKSDSEAYCNGSACTDPKGVELLSDARAAGNVATITGIAGITLVGAGVVLFFTAPSASTSVAVAPGYVAGGGSLTATGSF